MPHRRSYLISLWSDNTDVRFKAVLLLAEDRRFADGAFPLKRSFLECFRSHLVEARRAPDCHGL